MDQDPIRFELVKLTGCAVCADPVIFIGPFVLEHGRRICSEICDVLYKAITPGVWVDASELAPGGGLHNRPELWVDD
jgi:hypothetical protein